MSWISDAECLERVAMRLRKQADATPDGAERIRLLREAEETENEASLIRSEGDWRERDD